MVILDAEERVHIILTMVKIKRIIQLGNCCSNTQKGLQVTGIKNIDGNNPGVVIPSNPYFMGYLKSDCEVPIRAP